MAKETEIKLIVGLGNPGNEYADTRHNAGFWLVDALCEQFGPCRLTEEGKFKGATGTIHIGNNTVRLLKPNTFMNLSGQSVAALANFYKIDVEEILVAHDELDIDPGVARLKRGGGHGGHNGLRDIISSLGNSKMFARLRLGIGHPGKASQVASFVLKKAPSKDQAFIEDSINECIKHLPAIVAGDWQAAMNTLHSFNADPEARARIEAQKLAKEKKKQERALLREQQRAAEQNSEPATNQDSRSHDNPNNEQTKPEGDH